MKNKMTLLAAGMLLATGAYAQTNVTVYGVVDAGISRVDNGAGASWQQSSGNQSGSRLGFKGVEDLGGGLKASFTLENGFNVDDGTQAQGRLFGRQAWVGLDGNFGTVRLGRQVNTLFVAYDQIDPFDIGLAGDITSVFQIYGYRMNNTISYTSPEMGGFKGELMYGFGEVAGDNSANHQTSLGLGYANGPLNVQFAYHTQNTAAAGGALEMDNNTTFLGGKYNFGPVAVHAAYGRNRGEDSASVDTQNSNDIMLGVSAPFGASTILASYIRHDDKMTANNDANRYSLGYTYALSKRTNLYTSIAHQNNRNSSDANLFNVGVRHKF
jgi:predicted porin